MITFTPEFIEAFNFSMLYEVGHHFDPTDPETIAGRCTTQSQKQKTGYVNNIKDGGGETKFGIAKNSHPTVNIKSITLADAQLIYYSEYWLMGKCNKLKAPLSITHFDACVNHGTGRAAKILQEAAGEDIDGILGPNSLGVIESKDPVELTKVALGIRERFFKNIVKNKPSQIEFLDGWLARIESIEEAIA